MNELKHRRTQRRMTIEVMRRLWDAGIASGPTVDGEEAFQRIKQKLVAKIAQHKSA
jgi:antitoxin ParD1/3/4